MAQDQRYKEIQLPQLRSFCLAAKELNFTTAARALGLTAPTVWQQVRALERRLQTTLLRRQGRNVELTTEGRLLLDLVHPHVSGLDSIEALFFAQKSQLGRPLTVAAIPYLTSSYLLEPIREYRETRPQVPLKMHVCIWFSDALRMVERGQADLGVVFYDRDEPRSSNLTYDWLFDLRFVLLMPAGHALAARKRVHPRELVSHPLIVPPEGSFAHKTLKQLLRRHDLEEKVTIVMETPLLDIIKKYVEAGVGVAPVHIGEHEVLSKGLLSRPLGHVRESVAVCVVHRKGAHLSDPVREFAELLRRRLATKHPS